MVWTDFPPFSVGHVVDEDELNELVANLNLLHSAHGARAYLTANVSHVNGSVNIISMTSEDFDSDGYHSTSLNPSRLTVPAGLDGLYIIHAAVQYAATSSGLVPYTVDLLLNGTTSLATGTTGSSASTSVTPRPSVSTIAALATGDYIEMRSSQASGGSLNATAGKASTFLEMVWRGKL